MRDGRKLIEVFVITREIRRGEEDETRDERARERERGREEKGHEER